MTATVMYLRALCLLLILVAPSLLAQGPTPNVNDGNALQRECGAALEAAAERGRRGGPDDTDAGFDTGQCLGLVSAVWHTHMLMVDEFGGEVAFCPSRTISAGQMARLVDQYLKVHPEELDEWDTVLIMRAYMDNYPCQRRE
jgi:hypothetical protein